MKDNNQTVSDAEVQEVTEETKKDENTEEKREVVKDDIATLNSIIEKYNLSVLEKKILSKIVSLLETKQMRGMLPPQNIGDSVFKMYSSDDEPTEFLVDRVEFDDYGWNLVSYEKFGTSEVEFVFSERDYNNFFFDTAELAKEHYHKK
ncbi:MAG: hypothetical protein IIZ08_01485 [Clostridia bacterium]|nr:hypothetical protein [Clostridia bacterium]